MAFDYRSVFGRPFNLRPVCAVLLTLLAGIAISHAAVAQPNQVVPETTAGFTDEQRSVTTQLNNNARQGAYLAETALKPDNVAGPAFGKITQVALEGQMLAQPLYLRNVDIGGGERRNLVIVATAANIVYALDANNVRDVVFSKRLTADPVVVHVTRKETTDDVDIEKTNSLVNLCPQTYPPYIGVTSTPVIDPVSGTVFVEAYDSVLRKQMLYALSLHNRFAAPVAQEILPGDVTGDDKILWPMRHRNRPALLLSNGVVFVAFGSFICDSPQPFDGWVFGYRLTGGKFSTAGHWRTPAAGSGIWQSGRGLAASADGDIYFMTGNDIDYSDLKDHSEDRGDFEDPHLANSFVKLRRGGSAGLEKAGAFSPKNSSQLSAGDVDLGSSGPLLLPGGRLVGGGKQGRVYVIDTRTMRLSQNTNDPDGFQGFEAFINTYHDRRFDSNNKLLPSCTASVDDGDADRYCRRLQNVSTLNSRACPISDDCFLAHACYQFCEQYGPNIHAGFAYWQQNRDRGLLYAMPEKEFVKSFQYNIRSGTVVEKPASTSRFRVPNGMPGGALSVSANAERDGIVWVSLPAEGDASGGVHRGRLVALDALDLGHELWRDDCILYFAKFNPPTVADGKVYLATFAAPTESKHPNNPLHSVVPGRDADCKAPDPDVLDSEAAGDPQRFLRLKVGTSYLIEYGLR